MGVYFYEKRKVTKSAVIGEIIKKGLGIFSDEMKPVV